jgi:hypothetical protein
VEGSDTIDLVRADNGEESHSDVLGVSFLDKRHPPKAFGVTGVTLADLVDKVLKNDDQLREIS